MGCSFDGLDRLMSHQAGSHGYSQINGFGGYFGIPEAISFEHLQTPGVMGPADSIDCWMLTSQAHLPRIRGFPWVALVVGAMIQSW